MVSEHREPRASTNELEDVGDVAGPRKFTGKRTAISPRCVTQAIGPMDLYHLHMSVPDVAAAQSFYEKYFGFRRHFPEASEVFLKNDRGFLLALAPLASGETGSLPEWFHLGFHGATADEVRKLFGRMQEDRVAIAERWTEFESGTVKFHCFDPSGCRIEVRWDAPG
jgi:catechol 2,3-dioxygenase-like lactoylglutathione lyase family enzyme